jgi:hypothetical protein
MTGTAGVVIAAYPARSRSRKLICNWILELYLELYILLFFLLAYFPDLCVLKCTLKYTKQRSNGINLFRSLSRVGILYEDKFIVC